MLMKHQKWRNFSKSFKNLISILIVSLTSTNTNASRKTRLVLLENESNKNFDERWWTWAKIKHQKK